MKFFGINECTAFVTFRSKAKYKLNTILATAPTHSYSSEDVGKFYRNVQLIMNKVFAHYNLFMSIYGDIGD